MSTADVWLRKRIPYPSAIRNEYVPQCDCGHIRKYIEFLEGMKDQIATFLIARYRTTIGEKQSEIKRDAYFLDNLNNAKPSFDKGAERDARK